MLDQSPLPGFVDATMQSQAAFRAVMTAMSQPGLIIKAPEPINAPEPLNPVAAMVVLALCDFDTPLWMDAPMSGAKALRSYLSFHAGAPLVEDKTKADFALISSGRRLPDLSCFAQGTDPYPDRSTTLIVQVEALTNASGETLRGPGIETERRFGIAPLPDHFWTMAKANHRQFPRGVDMIFCSPTEIACLPRSTRIGSER